MREFLVKGANLVEAYHKAILTLHDFGEINECSDYNQKQRECSMTVFVNFPTAEPRISRLFIGGAHELQQYEMEMLDGILDFMVGAGEHTWEYTYHQRYAHQIPFIINELKRNPNSRRAIMNIRDFDTDSNCGHPACLQSIQYFVRHGKLDCSVLFRSNDLPEAFFMNAFALIRLQEKIATELGVEVGTYTHRANSMHCYEKDFDKLNGYYDRIVNMTSIEDVSFEYEGFYKEMMEEETPSIMKLVENQKKKYGII